MSRLGEPHVSIRAERRGAAMLLEVVGEVDYLSVAELRDALNDALSTDQQRLVLDLSGLRWLDSLGLGVLVAAWKRARAAGTDLVLWRPSVKAQAILRLSRLDQVLTVVAEAADPFRAA